MKKKILLVMMVVIVMLMSTGCGIEREVNHSGYTVEWRCE